MKDSLALYLFSSSSLHIIQALPGWEKMKLALNSKGVVFPASNIALKYLYIHEFAYRQESG